MSRSAKPRTEDNVTGTPRPRAVAYYRKPAREGHEKSIARQKEQVRKWAEENGIEVVREFTDS